MSAAPLPTGPVPDSELPPGVSRAVGQTAPLALKQMAARGLAPLPPQELMLALYQLTHDPDPLLQATARETAGKVAEPVLRAGLPLLREARVLDFYARRLLRSPVALDLLLSNRALPDPTVEHLARSLGEAELERIAADEERLLRYPAIITALYMNPRARSSTVMRAVELAARNNVVLDILGYDDLVASLKGVSISAADDVRFSEAVHPDGQPAGDGQPDKALNALTQEDIKKTQADEESLPLLELLKEADTDKRKKRLEELPVPLQIRAATLGSAFDRGILVRSPIRTVSMAAIRSPALGLNEVVKYAANRALHQDVINYISSRKEWLQLNAVRLALINNNKTPLSVALRLIPFLQPRDLKAVARSRDVPGPLVRAAKELVTKRETRGG